MFGIIADLLTSVTSVLFPVFASYKALRTRDPAQVTPWLMYWTTLSLFLAGESLLYPVISWIPFYSWIRFMVHLYLVLPGKQGSVYIYQSYIHPFLEQHERDIDRFISDSHERAKKAGLDYLKKAIEWARVNVLGMPPKQPTPPQSRSVSYSQSLLNRFSMPSAREGMTGMAGMAGAGTGDLLSLLGNAMQQTTSGSSRSREAQAADLSASGSLIPPSVTGEDRMQYINTQRSRLQTLIQAFDREAYGANAGSSTGHESHSPPSRSPQGGSPYMRQEGFSDLKKSKSEAEFEDLAYEELPDRAKRMGREILEGAQSGGWGRYIWGNYGEKDSAIPGKKDQ